MCRNMCHYSAKVLKTHYINTCDQCNTHHGHFFNVVSSLPEGRLFSHCFLGCNRLLSHCLLGCFVLLLASDPTHSHCRHQGLCEVYFEPVEC